MSATNEPTRDLHDGHAASAAATVSQPTAPTAGDPTEYAGRFRLLGEIARGGMGAVLRAHDPELGRDVAIKVILPGRGDEPTAVRRFLDEARLAGQLQHPGVAPVYDIGRLPDGQPFFAMKLIAGRTLAELLAQRSDAAQDLPRFVQHFAAICQTVAYAHAQGIIHRDLKPLNVMVGAFGEVQVMDWGLAKILASGGRQPPGVDAYRGANAPRSPELSAAGSVIGTPAYMPPEQSRGLTEQVDACSDVFALGAILCEILTGQPAYRGASTAEVCRRAASADLVDAWQRLDGCGADAELVQLAKACLAVEPAERPANGAAVAERVAAYQDGVQQRLRQAEVAQAQAEVRAEEERKRRRVQLGLAAAVLIVLLIGGGGAWRVQRQRQQADTATIEAMAEARLLLFQAQAAPLQQEGRFAEALAAARKAEQLARTGAASDEVQRQAAELVEVMDKEADAAQRDRQLLAALLEVRGPREGPTYQADERGLMMALAQPSADEQFASAFHAWGLDLDTAPTAEVAARLRARPAAVQTEIIAALDDWASERRRQRMAAAKVQRLTALAEALDEPGSRRRELRALLARGNLARERALAVLAVVLRPIPVPFDAALGEDRGRLHRLEAETDPATEPVLGLLTLTRALSVAGSEVMAERLLRAAVRARPQEVVFYQTLGQLLENSTVPRWNEAVECYAAARALRPTLGEALANALIKAGRAEDGLALYGRLAVENASNPWIHSRRGYALLDLRPAEAEAACRAALRLKPDDAVTHSNLGAALDHQGRYREAEAACRAALRLKPNFPQAHLNLGVALFRQDRYKEAEAAHRAALRLKPDLPDAHSGLGAALYEQGRYQEAEAAHRVALRLKPSEAGAHYNLGNTLSKQTRYKEAEAVYREALRLKPDWPEAHYGLGNALAVQGRDKETEAAYRAALRLKPDYAEAHYGLGAALYRQGRFKEAEAADRVALRLKPDFSEAHIGLGAALYDQGRYKEAEAACRAALRLKPDYLEAHSGLGSALGRQGRYKEAEAVYRVALRLKPDYPEAHLGLGVALNSQGQYKEAEAADRVALHLKPDFPAAHYNLGNDLFRQGRYQEAEAAYRVALRLKPDFPAAHIGLGRILQANGQFEEAVAAYREALHLKPDYLLARNKLRQAERLVELDHRLPAVLAGGAAPISSAERLEFASLCQQPAKRLHAAAVRLAAAAFADEPKLADDVNQPYRYNAACSAALAATGKAEDAKAPPDKLQQSLRLQALQWLRADLASYTKLAERDDPAARQTVQQRLPHWQADPDLAGVRDADALAKLGEAERAAWRRLWADVDALRQRAR